MEGNSNRPRNIERTSTNCSYAPRHSVTPKRLIAELTLIQWRFVRILHWISWQRSKRFIADTATHTDGQKEAGCSSLGTPNSWHRLHYDTLDNETASRCGRFTFAEENGWSFKTTCIRSGSSTLLMEAAGSSKTRMHKFPINLKVKEVTSNRSILWTKENLAPSYKIHRPQQPGAQNIQGVPGGMCQTSGGCSLC